MTWLILGVAAAAIAGVVLFMRRELSRWQEGGSAFSLVVPLRVINGAILIMLILLMAGGLIFALPRAGVREPSPMMLTYWVFIGFVTLTLMLLAMLDMMLVRRGYQRRQEEVLRDVLLGAASRQHGGDDGPEADGPA